MSVEPLRELAAAAPGRVRFVTRFVEDAEIPAIFRAADLVVLPYLDAEHSGVLYTGLAFGKPLILSAVGGFPEVAATGAARLVEPGDTAALAAALEELASDGEARTRLAAAAVAAAAGPYSWEEAARRTLELYRELIEADRELADDRPRRDRLLGLRRCSSSTRTSATRWCCAALRLPAGRGTRRSPPRQPRSSCRVSP